MSRLAQSKAAPIALRTLTKEEGDEACPICKTNRWQNPNLRILITPKCYHKMCESCIDRIYANNATNPCPAPHCSAKLRKRDFRTQTFEDIQVEREIDIRRQVASVFNRREEDFESLRHWNDYLNDVEDITFNLVNKIDIEGAKKRLEEHRRVNEEDIEEAEGARERERVGYVARQREEKERAKGRRAAAARETQEAAARKRDGQTHMGLKSQALEQQRQGQPLIKGLKTRTKPEPEKPVDPFAGLQFKRKYSDQQPDGEYCWSFLQEPRQYASIMAGGCDLGGFTRRILTEAFSGLGIFVADEATERQRIQEGTDTSTPMAGDVDMKDVF